MGLIQKIAVITGAGTGVGQSCTLALLSEGYSVVLAGRRENRLKETVFGHLPGWTATPSKYII